MKKLTMLLVCLAFLGIHVVSAQSRTVTGTVTSSDDGSKLPGVNVIVKGTTTGTITNADGFYSLSVGTDASTLVFSFVGMKVKEVVLGTSNSVDVVMEPETIGVDEVIVTALGISREKKSVGYAVQEIDNSEVNTVKSDNFVKSMAGKVAGVQIKNSGNMGGSTDIVIRGSSSITGNNQALFVVDGIPISNANTNNMGQLTGRNGYDYGSGASDINPNDIESVSILKGAAATALYGSRGANGVVMITTKKGSKGVTQGKAFGVNLSSNVTIGVMDKETFPKYQQEYGAGYGPYYSGGDHIGLEEYDVDGDGTDDLVVPFYEDASYGEKFDPNLLVYQWDAAEQASPNYMKKTPWVAGANGPETFFQKAISYTNSVDINGRTDRSDFRLSYTNLDQRDIMPNSRLKRNNVIFNGSFKVLDNLKVSAQANFVQTIGKGRNSTGYSDNIMSSFRQWYQVNVDVKMLKDLFDKTGRNVTWNRNAFDDPTPAYWDSPYWVRYKNYETDKRNRLIGYTQVDYSITSELSLMGRVSVDTYNELQEERKAVGSVAGEFGVGRNDVTSGYSRFERSFMETNIDVMFNYKKDLSDKLNLNANLGSNFRRNSVDDVFASTNGGLGVPNVYALSNSSFPMLQPEESSQKVGVNGYFGLLSLGYDNFLFLDATYRYDISSTLPKGSWGYSYPSVSASFLFDKFINSDMIQLGKLRLNYAEVGNDAPFDRVGRSYRLGAPFSGVGTSTVPNVYNNANLVPERTKSYEAGLEMNFAQSRLGFDFAWYKMNTVDQIIESATAFETGYSGKMVNAGEVENKGTELMLFGIPVKTDDFEWKITLNWNKNKNKVISLDKGSENLEIAALQGGVTINARVGEPYGTIQGTDNEFLNGKPLIDADGYYVLSSTSDKILGNINPDWNGSLANSITYKDWTLSFLFDMQKGGSIFSLDMWYGMGTGLYEETVYNNDLGNPVRNSLDDGGGLILDGVQEDGTPNTVRIAADDYYPFGWASNPNSKFVYDASYIKLRELVISYNLPTSLLNKINISRGSLSFVGSNLWIVSKDLPHADPEASQSNGNIQGWQSGVMPSTKNFGFSLNLQF